MPSLPSARQKTRSARRGNRSRDNAERSLVLPFATFTQAADSLEKSYGQLQTEAARLSGELERANSELTNSLDENTRVRSFLAQILESLPCGVLVLDAGTRLRVINPQARRLLMLDPSWLPEEGVALPAVNPTSPAPVVAVRTKTQSQDLSNGLSGNNSNNTSTAGTFSTTVAANDALGASHVLTYTFTKTAANSWNYSITIPAADVGATGNPVVLKTGTLSFNGSGQLVTPAANVAGIAVTGFADGASNLTFGWESYDSNGTGLLTQVSGASATSSTLQDGFPSGILSSFNIDSTGIIGGIFSNGQTVPVAQIALASFSNLQGLLRNGSNDFRSTLSSGAANIGQPGTTGRGTIAGGSLELSNADIATEFSKPILAESGYEANTKTVTAFDQVTQTAINLKQ